MSIRVTDLTNPGALRCSWVFFFVVVVFFFVFACVVKGFNLNRNADFGLGRGKREGWREREKEARNAAVELYK